MSAESDKVFSNIVPYLHKILVLSEEPYDKYYEKAAKYILKGTGQRNLKKKKTSIFALSGCYWTKELGLSLLLVNKAGD